MKKTALFISMAFVIATGCSHKMTGNKTDTKKATIVDTTGRINLQQGQKYEVDNKITTSSSSQMQGQAMETKADINTVYNIDVNDIEGDNYNMSNKISTLKLAMSTMGQDINFDSEKKEDMDGQMGAALKGIINEPNKVVMDKAGNITPSAKDTTKDAAASASEMMLKQIGDPASMGYGAKMAFLVVPKKATTGTAWKDSTSADGVTRITNYTIKSIAGSIATVAISGTENRDTKMEMQGMEINTKTTGTFNGERTVNVNTGVIITDNLTGDSKGSISVMGQEIPTTIKVTSMTTVKLM